MWLNIYWIFTLAHLCTPVKVSRGLLPSTTAHPSCKAFSRTSTPLFGLLYSQRCRSYSPPRSRSGTAHPSSSWCQEVREAAASRAWRGHPAGSRMCCQERTVMSEVLPWQTWSYFVIIINFQEFLFFFCRFEQAKHHQICFEWIKLFFSPTTVLSKSAATYCTALSYLVTMDWIFCHMLCAYIVRVLIACCCCHLLSCHSVVAWSDDISLSEMDSFTAKGKSQWLWAEHRTCG